MTKEIYFGQDVFKEVGDELGVNKITVEKVFNSFLASFKKNIENTDEILYVMPYIGDMYISEGEALSEIKKYQKKIERTKNKTEKERLRNVIKNYRVRLKKIRIELYKNRHKKGFSSPHVRNTLLTQRRSLTSRSITHKRKMFNDLPIEEVMRLQNEYAYQYYKKNNLPIEL